MTIEELRATVERMEARLAREPDETVTKLTATYGRLKPRFAADFDDERDILLSRGGALMLIQEFARR